MPRFKNSKKKDTLGAEKNRVAMARRFERRDCLQFEKCLTEAAMADAPCVPCRGCKKLTVPEPVEEES